jgi:hypothetical protein
VLSIREILVTPWLGKGFAGTWNGFGLAAITAWNADVAREALAEAGESRRSRVGAFFAAPMALERAPQSFASLKLAVFLSAELFPRAEEAILDAIRDQHVSFTVERIEDGYGILVAKKALGKRVILGGKYRRTAEGLSLELTAGRKLDVGGLFSRFPDTCAASRAVLGINDLQL